MASNTSYLTTTQLDVDAYRESLKAFLKAKPNFKDADFEASNLAVLLGVLSINTFNEAFYLNQVGSESFNDSASLKQSVVSHSKELNYIPRSRSSSVATVNIIVNSTTNVSTITVPSNFYFSAIRGSQTYLYTLAESVILRNSGGVFQSGDVSIYEGRLVTENFIVTNNSRYCISSPNIDISSIKVNVTNSTTDPTLTTYTKADTLFGLDENSTVFFIQGYLDNYYEITFGNGITGKILDIGNIVSVTYRDCSASAADGIYNFKAVSALVDQTGNIFNDITVACSANSSGGAEREDMDSIKFNGPKSFAVQDRTIIPSDYEILIKKNFPSIQTVSVFGGETLPQKQYGKVAISLKPYNSYTASNYLKDQIATFLSDKKVLNFYTIFIDPDYYFVEITSNVVYNTKNTTETTFDIETAVRGAITSYSDTYLYNFGTDFRFSRMSSLIDASDSSIVSNDTSIRMVKRIVPFLNIPLNQVVNFGNTLQSAGVGKAIVESSFFNYIHTDGQTYNVKVQDDGQGNLFIINDKSVILVKTTGSVDYVNGVVTLINLTVASYLNNLNLYVTLKGKDISINASQIVSIDQADVTVNVTGINE